VNILAIMAHQDDVEFQCAGSLALLKKLGHKVGIVTVNNGSCGTTELRPDEIAAIRAREARSAADLIGAEYYCVGTPDLESVFDNDHRRRVCEIVRNFAAGVVIAPYPADYMSDHEVAGRLARDATFTPALPNYPTHAAKPSPRLAHIPHLYYCLPVEGLDHFGNRVTPSFAIDISGVLEEKAKMLCCHASQREWLLKQHGMDEYVEFMKREAKRVGALAGFAFGEGFIQHLGHAYPRNNVLAELLPSKSIKHERKQAD